MLPCPSTLMLAVIVVFVLEEILVFAVWIIER
jgi:hypothetical protein